MERRRFLSSLVTSTLLAATARAENLLKLVRENDRDEEICLSTFKMAIDRGLENEPIGRVVTEIGKSFVGTTYKAHTLEQPGPEQLVINLQGFDCVSFYENSLALARCVKMKTTTFDAFKKQIQWIRYRSGVIDGYPSRLHYISDYFYDNVRKGVVRDITRELGGVPFTKKINFMSTHPEDYPKLKEHPEFVEVIRKQEEEINARKTFYLPKDQVAGVIDKIQDGDIMGTTTSIEGIDTSHTGMAIWQDGEVHFMHAPLAGGAVEISTGNLSQYLMRIEKMTGIFIVRPLEPA